MPEPRERSASSDDTSRQQSADRVLVAACVALIAGVSIPILAYGYGRDQGIFAMVARALLAGDMPYRDAWDFKPPGIFVIYAAARALFGVSQAGIRILEVTGLVAMTIVMSCLTQRFWGEWRIGLLGAAIGILVHAQLDFWHTAQPESFGGMLTIFALSIGTRQTPSKAGRALSWIAAGALFGAAGLLKPPLAGGAAVLAAALAFDEQENVSGAGKSRFSAAIWPVFAVGLGGAACLGACALWFFARGALTDLIEVLFVFTPHYAPRG